MSDQKIDPEIVRNTMRPIRLYHWVKVLKHRQISRDASGSSNLGNRIADSHEKIANQHLGFVQALNEYFEIGDTAERDQIALEAIGEQLL